ncbi:MAG: hypothetical protein ACJ752_04280 [Gaiellaceae bacterium]
MAIDELRERFANVTHPVEDPDWFEVVRLANPRRGRRWQLLLPVAAALALIMVAPAFGLGGKIIRMFSSGTLAPTPIVRSFAKLDRGAPPGFRTGVASAQTRRIVLPGNVALWIAPTSEGGFCIFVDGGGGQCDAARVLTFWPTFSIGGDVTPNGTIKGGPVLVEGSTTLQDGASVEVQFENGTSVTVPVVWISDPIDAGVFAYAVPTAHLQAGARPDLLILRDAAGNELQRDSSAFQTPDFRRGPSNGLVPCIVRGGGDACMKAAFGPGAQLPDARRPDPDPPSSHSNGRLPWRGR